MAVPLGLDFPTGWARRTPATAIRDVALAGAMCPLIRFLSSMDVRGRDHLVTHGRMIFASNHVSQLDTVLVLTALPLHVRQRTVVAAAADTFYESIRPALVTTLFFNAIPIERHKVNRRSAEDAQRVIEEGWHLLIFPEGGRTKTGGLEEFKGGPAFLAEKTGATIVPTFLNGAGDLMGPRYAKAEIYRNGGMKVRSHVTVAFGPALHQLDGENVRRFGARIQESVAVLGREVTGDDSYGRPVTD